MATYVRTKRQIESTTVVRTYEEIADAVKRHLSVLEEKGISTSRVVVDISVIEKDVPIE